MKSQNKPRKMVSIIVSAKFKKGDSFLCFIRIWFNHKGRENIRIFAISKRVSSTQPFCWTENLLIFQWKHFRTYDSNVASENSTLLSWACEIWLPKTIRQLGKSINYKFNITREKKKKRERRMGKKNTNAF